MPRLYERWGKMSPEDRKRLAGYYNKPLALTALMPAEHVFEDACWRLSFWEAYASKPVATDQHRSTREFWRRVHAALGGAT